MFKSTIIVMLLSSLAFSQPDAPSTAQPVAPVKCEHWCTVTGDFPRSNWETFRAKQWWIPAAALTLASIADAEVTHQGLAGHHQGCVEGNVNLPQRPSRAQLYRETMIPALALDGLGFLLVKVRFPGAAYTWGGIGAYGSALHSYYAYDWAKTCW